jgi:competence CoiA-like predicted nuclease
VPLKAIVDGETIIGPDLSKEEWTTLRSRHKKGLTIKMGCCGALGHLRISKKGTQHFYHAVDTGCNYEQESKEHLEIKYQIYKICKSEQWETYVEFPASDRTWISDVYAIKDGRKIVFEIQISTISPNDLEEREKKYRNVGIESYWLLDNFLERSRDFESWYYSHLYEEDDRLEETIPYIDDSIFDTGPENHIFISKGIRSVGLNAKNQTLFTTNNPAIPLEVWVREVLKGNYQKYLEETAAAYYQKRQLKILAAPVLIQFREFYHNIIRYETYKKKVGYYYRIFKTDETLLKEKALQKKFDEIYFEIDWLGKEYRSFIAES